MVIYFQSGIAQPQALNLHYYIKPPCMVMPIPVPACSPKQLAWGLLQATKLAPGTSRVRLVASTHGGPCLRSTAGAGLAGFDLVSHAWIGESALTAVVGMASGILSEPALGGATARPLRPARGGPDAACWAAQLLPFETRAFHWACRPVHVDGAI